MESLNQYSAEQIANIRNDLSRWLEKSATQALNDLDQVIAAQKSEKPSEIEGAGKKNMPSPNQVDTKKLGSISKLMESLEAAQGDAEKQRELATTLINRPDIRALHFVEALEKIGEDLPLINVLTKGLIAKGAVMPMIEGLHLVTKSNYAFKLLSRTIAQQASSNNIIRAINAAPKDHPESEITWSVVLIGKGTQGQILEAMHMMRPTSPGIIILAVGLAHHPDITLEPLIRGIGYAEGNKKAEAILTVTAVRHAEPNVLITLLEKHIFDHTEGGEIVISELIRRTLENKNLFQTLCKAIRFVKNDSMGGRILATGILKLGDKNGLEQAFSRLTRHPSAKKIVGYGILKKYGMIPSLLTLGTEFFQLNKSGSSTEEHLKEARERYLWILETYLTTKNTKPQTKT